VPSNLNSKWTKRHRLLRTTHCCASVRSTSQQEEKEPSNYMPQKASRAFGLRRQSDAIHVFCWKRQTDADVRANCQATSLGNETFSAHHVDIVCSCSYAHHVDIVCLLELRRVTKLRAAWIQHSTTEVVNAYCILHIGAVYHTASSHFSVLTSLTKLTAASS
jgi:hypothetical protein